MPKVGKGNKAVEYPYSRKGRQDAMAHAKRTGESLEMGYGNGGKVIPKYGHGGMVNPMMPMRPMYKHGGPVPKYPGGGMVKPMYKHGGPVMSPMQKMALRKRISDMMMHGGKVNKKKK